MVARYVASLAPLKVGQDTVMLALAAREQALCPLPVKAVKFADVGDQGRSVKVDDRPVSGDNFERVCNFLGIPAGFIKTAPLDLANSIATRMLKEEKVSSREMIIDERKGLVVGYQPKGTRFVPASHVMEQVFEAIPDAEGAYLFETERAVDVNIVCRNMDIEPKKGDIVRGGLSCFYSEIDTKKSAIRAYSERLVCTNGMTHRDFEREFGVVDDLDIFLGEIRPTVQACLDHVAATLEPKLKHAAEFEVDGPQAIRRIFRQSRLPAKFMDAVLAAFALEADGTAFGVLQAFTRAANTLRHRERAKLQEVAGAELTAVEKAHCPKCYAVM